MQENLSSSSTQKPQHSHLAARYGAGWLYKIAFFSAINVALVSSGIYVRFLVGLGINELLAALHSDATNILNFLIPVVFLGLGKLTMKGSRDALIVGVVIYVLDAGLLLLLQDWVGFGFHLYVLYRISIAIKGFHYKN